MLMFIFLALLPNTVFWFDTFVYQENFTCWYKPPRSDLENMIESVVKTSVPQMRKKINELEKKLNQTANSNKDPGLQAQLTKELNSLKESLAEAEMRAINMNVQMQDSLVEHAKGIPKIFWLMSSVNTGLGTASYILWDESSFLPLVSYAGFAMPLLDLQPCAL
uniref:Cysteine--tRNA ligase n=1 Tax=Lygus hesperus TaxID=30085 RepID=A0A0A9YFU8_LYGHE